MSISLSISHRRNCIKKSIHDIDVALDLLLSSVVNCEGYLFGVFFVLVKCACCKKTERVVTKLNLILITIAIIFDKMKVY